MPHYMQKFLRVREEPSKRRRLGHTCDWMIARNCHRRRLRKSPVAAASVVGSVQHFVATSAKRDEISLSIVADCAAPSQMVNIKILETATCLTAPAITRQDFLAQPRIRRGSCLDSMPLLGIWVAHVAFSVGSDGS
jgi:hypothetical protein